MNSNTLVEAQRITHALWTLIDQRRYEDMLQLLAPDCSWLRQEGWRTGHEEIRASLNARPQQLYTRHVITNFHAEAKDGELVGYCYLVAFAAISDDHDAPQTIDHPAAVADITTTFTEEGGQVLIKKIDIKISFAKAQ